MRVPVWRAQADEGWHKDKASAIRNACCKGFYFGRGTDEAEVVPQPLHNRSTDEDAALQRVFQPMLRASCKRGDQPVFRAHEACTDVLQQKASGAICVLGFPGAPA